MARKKQQKKKPHRGKPYRHPIPGPNEIIDDETARQRLEDALERNLYGLVCLAADDEDAHVCSRVLGWVDAHRFRVLEHDIQPPYYFCPRQCLQPGIECHALGTTEFLRHPRCVDVEYPGLLCFDPGQLLFDTAFIDSAAQQVLDEFSKPACP